MRGSKETRLGMVYPTTASAVKKRPHKVNANHNAVAFANDNDVQAPRLAAAA